MSEYEYLNCKQVADLLQVDVQYVRKLANVGAIESFKVGRQYRFDRRHVDAFVASRKASPLY